MDIQHQFPGVHWVWGGGISFVYEVHPLIVVKVPKSGEEERERFRKELKIYRIFSQNPPCGSLVQCFLYTTDGIFLEYMRDISLAYRKQFNLIRDHGTHVVTKVKQMEPLPLRMSWMNDLAQGVAFLGSLNLAHGDLRPENILLDREKLKLSDFDCTADLEQTLKLALARTTGFLCPRTEQFALGSLYYLINYGFEVYDDRCLADDPYEHGPKVINLLQEMKFSKLTSDPLIDDIIDKCWHNQYRTLAELATHTEELLKEPPSEAPNHKVASSVNAKVNNGDSCCNLDEGHSSEDFTLKQGICQDLEKRGLLRLLTSGKPMELGFCMEHRHVLSTPTTPS